MNKDEFDINKEKGPNYAKFTLKGRVNSINVPMLQHKLDEALRDGEINIVLNMAWVEYLSSAGIRVILKTHKDAARAGGSFGIEYPSENVRNVLGMAALDEMLI
ncbi:MAG: STAS domain-containing protein [Treponema sp.]|nr:STAS domain-containing protein [Treponema sp.]